MTGPRKPRPPGEAEADLRLKLAKAEIMERRSRAEAGEYVPVKKVEQALESLATIFRSRLMALPDRAAAEACNAENLNVAREVLRRYVEEVLTDIAHLDLDFTTEVEAVGLSLSLTPEHAVNSSGERTGTNAPSVRSPRTRKGTA